MFLFDRLRDQRITDRHGSPDMEELRESVLLGLGRIFERGNYFLCDESLASTDYQIPYGPNFLPGGIRVGEFTDPGSLLKLEVRMLQAIEENEPRIKEPSVEIRRAKDGAGRLHFVLRGKIGPEAEAVTFSSVIDG